MSNEQLRAMVDKDLSKLEFFENIYQHQFTGSPLKDEFVADVDFEELFNDMINIISGLHSRYSIFIKDFPEDMNLKDMEKYSNDDSDMAQVFFYTYIKRVVEKLRSFKMNGYQDRSDSNMTNNININNEVNASSTSNSSSFSNANSVSVLSFEDAKKSIEEMSALNDTEIDEILKKIDELEQIINTSERKSKKWESVKGIIKWVADKSFDVAKIIIPLAFKIEGQ